MPTDRRLPLWAGRTAALLGILLVALSLRTSVAALSPIITFISHDVSLSPLVLGIIGVAPPVTFALTGLATPWLSHRLGLERSLLVAAGLMAIGQIARALAPTAGLLVTATVVTLVGAGLGNVLLPPVVKRYFSDRITQVTTSYAVLISLSTAMPALLAVPFASAFGWRFSLGVWFLIAVAAIVPWIVASVVHLRSRAAARQDAANGDKDEDEAEAEPRLEGRMIHSRVAWAVMIAFSISSINVYAFFAWLPDLLVQTAHVSSAQAGALLALYAIMGFPCSLLVPYLAGRIHNVGLILYVAIGLFFVGDAGLLFAPAAAPILWVAFAGLGPLLFPLSLVLINARTRTHAGSVALSGFVQGVGYIIATASPLVFGLLEQVTHSWAASLAFLFVLSLAAIPAGIILSRGHFVEDELAAAESRRLQS
ncbi:MAG TPA: MFS transporter [Galbitalea sp.]|nr:MFS transporter [Galbitalea sp.]